jgi:hypothetical protein
MATVRNTHDTSARDTSAHDIPYKSVPDVPSVPDDVDHQLLTDGDDAEIAALVASGNWLGEASPIAWHEITDPIADSVAGGGWVWVDAAVLEAVPGPDLARQLANTGVGELDDDGLLSAASAWRRLGSWAKAGELAAVAAFLDRRVAHYPGDSRALDAAMAELQCALGYLTNTAMAGLASLAEGLCGPLTDTWQGLRAGRIDEAKAHIITTGTWALDPAKAHLIEQRVLPTAPEQSTGQLRAAVARAVLAVDPEGAERRRRRAQTGRRVELRPEGEHTASLAGRDLPIAQALAVDQRITAIATTLKNQGDQRPLQYLRATAYLHLLLGTTPQPPDTSTTPDPPGPHSTGPDSADPDSPGSGSTAPPRGTHRPDTPSPNSPDPGSPGPDWPGPDSAGPDSAGSDSAGPDSAGSSGPGSSGAVSIGVAPGFSGTASEGGFAGGGVGSRGSVEASGSPAMVVGSSGIMPRFVPYWRARVEVHLTVRARDLAALSDHRAGRLPDSPNPAARQRRRDHEVPLPVAEAAAHSIRPIRLIVPLETVCGKADKAGEVPGFGPIPAHVARTIAADGFAGQHWCYSILDDQGRAIGHGHIQPRHPHRLKPDHHDRLLIDLLTDIGHQHRNQDMDTEAAESCTCEHGAYQVRGRLRHQIETRDRTCRFPTCRQPATRCDIDHTHPHDLDGPSCPHNLSVLCRRHHAIKQTPGWALTQPTPGLLMWTTPSGREYQVHPDDYPH